MASIPKMRKCKHCGTDVSVNVVGGAYTCPSCNKINKTPFYKRGWFIAVVVLVVLYSIGTANPSEKQEVSLSTGKVVEKADETKVVETKKEEVKEEVKIEPVVVTTDELYILLKENALKASKTYKNVYVKLTGKLSNIDSSGDYFSLEPMEEEFAFQNVQCMIKKEHLDKVMEFKDGQTVVVLGTISDVGEIMGYTLEVESIE